MMFPDFRRTVTITDRKDREYQVKMLPVFLYDEYVGILEQTASIIKDTGNMVSAFVHGRQKLRTLAMTVLPKDLRRELMYLDYDKTATLVNFLFHGGNVPLRPNIDSGNTAPDGAGKDTSKILDFQLLAVRVLTIYPGYTLETLLTEPLPVFFKLAELAPRVQADRALSELGPAVSAAVKGGQAYNLLREVAGDKFIDREIKETYTEDEYKAAVDRMSAPNQKIIKERKIGGLV